MSKSVKEIAKSMADQGFGVQQIELFSKLYSSWQRQSKTTLDWGKIKTPDADSILPYKDLAEVTEKRATKLLGQLAVCRLNGGLGTSMGCIGPKSAIEVRGGQSFLDLIVTQISELNARHNTEVPLVLMNSFNTEQDTLKIIKKYEEDLTIFNFTQNEFPRLRRDSFLPMNRKKHGDAVSYPPGHGDFFDSIHQSGILDALLAAGKEFMFVANADNLGASVDLKILSEMERSNTPFLMEVTQKTRADVKGGTLVKAGPKGLRLLEIAQVPKENVEEFKSVKTFKIFNTNNLWINLRALKDKLDNGGLELEVIENKKTVNHLPVLQLETAIGGAIANFKGARAIQVPRSRFLPVKKTDDLLLVQSNLFVLQDGVLVRNPERQFAGLPLIRLGPYFKNFEDYQQRFETIPDILELDLLTVVGDVTFGSHITLRGNVILVCEQGGLQLPDGTTLENKVLTGSIKMGEL
ncbi:MAG: UTP--glucose-1-phosphate uridylyltransferase [bacterium]|nr:UTP--glucose-1-phosphate uridylyltransferase [bacterium]